MAAFTPRMREHLGRLEIFDIIRKKFVAYTPEESVRQQLLHYLTVVKRFPEGLLQVETAIPHPRYFFRADVVAYDRQLQPILLAECKAPEVTISRETCEQVARYNLLVKVPFLLITNGSKHFFFYYSTGENCYIFDRNMADYEGLVKMAKKMKIEKNTYL
ncbi:MAG: type I restriction enzyme HsdR N-terminal domain-containing protein [Prevotellaceae bacterium]|jgi:type I site-specific restriction endonuclease|nr:type I restriction enzyme HsdR N-terminal domain-containing protein [Prevotellaceae bacterium]